MTAGGRPNPTPDRFDLSGRVIWVAGGNGLLGSAISHGLAEHGAHVVVAGRNVDRSESVVQSISSRGGSAEARPLDVRDESAIDAQARSIAEDHGRMDACLNLTYHSTGKSFDALTASEWDEGLRISGTGAFLIARAASNVMTAGGSIVQFGSMYGVVSPDPANYPDGRPINPPDYGFAKAGLLQLVRYQAVTVGSRGIRVNAIVPGPFPGPAAGADPSFVERLARRVPLGRVGIPEELVGAAIFLCSDASSFMTGTSLTIDGGWTAW